ncbi:unnamed protein product, partial [Ilex paraguariensis]
TEIVQSGIPCGKSSQLWAIFLEATGANGYDTTWLPQHLLWEKPQHITPAGAHNGTSVSSRARSKRVTSPRKVIRKPEGDLESKGKSPSIANNLLKLLTRTSTGSLKMAKDSNPNRLV